MKRDILYQYIEGTLDQQQNEEVVRWLDEDEMNMQEFLLLRGVYDASLWNDPEPQSSFIHAKRYKLLREFVKVAAIFIFAIGCSYLFLPKSIEFKEPEIVMQTVYVPEGQRAEVFLADGTKVWLNAKTSLTFPNRFTDGERRVELNGEAFFDVEKDMEKHFVVFTKGYHIKVLGTEFNVKAYHQDNYFETALLKGSVEIVSDVTHQRMILTPNTYAYQKEGELVQAVLQNKDHFLWKEGIISFENESVKSIFSKLELYYDITIDLQNTKIADHSYTGKFRTKDGVEQVLKVLQLRHQFTYTKDNETNIIVIR